MTKFSRLVGVFTPLEGWKSDSVSFDNNIFKLHYRITFSILSIFTLIVSSKQFFGEPIHCIGDNEKQKDALNNFCWIFGTHTAVKHLAGTEGKSMAHFGVGARQEGDEEIHHLYYQWVCLMLPLQAVLFSMPHVLWKLWEGGKITCLTKHLNSPVMPTEWDEKRQKELVKHLIDTSLYTRNLLALQFFFCELLNFCNVIVQIFLLNKFLGGMFIGYGAAVASFYHHPLNSKIVNPMDKVFPKVTTCLFTSYGHSGSIQKIDLLCVLPVNIINQKIFAFMWFWLLFLAILSGAAVIYRILILLCPCLRAYVIMAQAKLAPKHHIVHIVHSFRPGDWFVLHLLGKNLNCFVFKDLIILLGQELEKSKKTEYVI